MDPRRSALPAPTVTALAGALVVACVAPAGARADAQDVAAPLGVTTPGPIRQLFLDPVLTDARNVTRPSIQLRLESANSWSVPARFTRGTDVVFVQTDTQADALVLAAVVPWSLIGPDAPAMDWRRRFATTVGWKLTSYWGGFTDGIIEWWHELIHSTNFLRQNYPRDQVNLQLLNGDGSGPFDFHSGRFAWGDLVVGTQAVLASGGVSGVTGARPNDEAWAVAARLDVKLPVGSIASAGGSGGFDAALSVLGTVELAPWIVLHGRTSASLVSPMNAPSLLQPNTVQLGAEVSAVLIAGRWALVIEDRYLSALMDGTGWTLHEEPRSDLFFLASPSAALFRPHNQITVGIRRDNVTFSVSEDFTPGDNPRGSQHWFYNSNAPDVVFALTVRLP